MMKVVRWLTAVAGIASILSVQAPYRAFGATGDPEIILYRFPGVTDNGGAAITGVATSFICTNFSGVAENFRIVVRDGNGGVVANRLVSNIPHLVTVTFSTHDTNLLLDSNLLTGAVAQGTAAIAVTSTSVVCTAMIIDAASSSSPQGIALHGIRFNPVPGTQE